MGWRGSPDGVDRPESELHDRIRAPQVRLVGADGQPLPGVTVTLEGPGSPAVQVTDETGKFRFLGLFPGTYLVRAELQGFSTLEYPDVGIRVGGNTALEIVLSGAVQDVITVTGESPLIDERQVNRGANVAAVELDRSSGLKVLDEAAFRIVRMASPYAAFPPEIRRDTDLLVITRTWFFGRGDQLRTE